MRPDLPNALPDQTLVARILAGERALFEVIIRRYNATLLRIARSVVRNDDEAQDVVQEAYVRAYANLASYDAQLGRLTTWLARIALNEALMRMRRRKTTTSIDDLEATSSRPAPGVPFGGRNPEQAASNEELAVQLGEAIDALPQDLRAVFVMRAVENLSVSETAAMLEVPEGTVKTRLFRARALLQKELCAHVDNRTIEPFPQLAGIRCDAIVQYVMTRLTA
jgi:RNA polymerase sigma-70 factor (ECF subfamily)